MPTDSKPLWQSKTAWLNVLALVASLVASLTGSDLPPDVSVALLAALNLTLRIVTGTPIDWGTLPMPQPKPKRKPRAKAEGGE